MPNQQETIDRDLRMLLGDLQVQLIFARARIAELEGVLADALTDKHEELKDRVAGGPVVEATAESVEPPAVDPAKLNGTNPDKPEKVRVPRQ